MIVNFLWLIECAITGRDSGKAFLSLNLWAVPLENLNCSKFDSFIICFDTTTVLSLIVKGDGLEGGGTKSQKLESFTQILEGTVNWYSILCIETYKDVYKNMRGTVLQNKLSPPLPDCLTLSLVKELCIGLPINKQTLLCGKKPYNTAPYNFKQIYQMI